MLLTLEHLRDTVEACDGLGDDADVVVRAASPATQDAAAEIVIIILDDRSEAHQEPVLLFPIVSREVFIIVILEEELVVNAAVVVALADNESVRRLVEMRLDRIGLHHRGLDERKSERDESLEEADDIVRRNSDLGQGARSADAETCSVAHGLAAVGTGLVVAVADEITHFFSVDVSRRSSARMMRVTSSSSNGQMFLRPCSPDEPKHFSSLVNGRSTMIFHATCT